MSINPNGRQVTDNGIEEKVKIDVDGLGSFETTQTTTAENNVIVSIPNEVADLGPDAVDKFKRHASDILDAGGKTLNERMGWNREEENRNLEREKSREELLQLKKEIDALKERGKQKPVETKVPSITELIAKELGVTKVDDSDVREFIDDNVLRYNEILEERQDMLFDSRSRMREVKTLETIKAQTFQQKIVDAGYDLQEVERFKRDSGFSDLEHAFRFYQRQNKPTASPIDIINNAERSKKRTVSFLEAGDVHKNAKSAMDELNEMDPNVVKKLPYDHPLLVRAREELQF